MSDLSQAFWTAYTTFNTRDWPALRALLTNDVELVSVNHRHTKNGINDVGQYFQTQFEVNRPTFQPTVYHVTDSGNTGEVTGKAAWTDFDPDDPDGTHIDGTIMFRFDFRKNGNDWLISRLWGSADHLVHHP